VVKRRTVELIDDLDPDLRVDETVSALPMPADFVVRY